MIAYTALLLFLIGIFSGIKVGVKADKLLAYGAFASLFLIFATFFESVYLPEEYITSFIWNTSRDRELRFDIISNAYNCGLVFPFFAVTMFMVANNLIFRHEERRSYYISVVILNLVALIVLITSNNFVQLLAALYFIDILALFMIKNAEACKRLLLMNIAADTLLFAVLAMINSRVDSLDIRQILLYRKIGFHVDFIAICGLTAVFAKLGFFLFQLGIIGLKKIRFHRLQTFLFLSSPAAAIILLLKFNTLWRTSEYFTSYVDGMCLLTMVWGFICSIAIDNFKSKFIYWQMMFWALAVELLRYHGFLWDADFTSLFGGMFLFSNALYMLHYYGNRRSEVSQMMRLRLASVTGYNAAYLLILLSVVVLSNTLTAMYNNINRYSIWIFAVLFVLSISTVVGQLYFSKAKYRKLNVNRITFKSLHFGVMLALTVILLRNVQYHEVQVWGFAAAFMLLCLLSPLHSLSFLYVREGIQSGDWLGKIYLLQVKSLRLCGKILSFLVDRMFLENFIMGTLTEISKFGFRLFRHLHSSRLIGGTLVILIITGLLWLSFEQGGVNG